MRTTKRLTSHIRQVSSAMLVWVLSATLAAPVQAQVTITDIVHGDVVVHDPVTQVDGRVRTEIAQSTARAIVHASDFSIAPNHIVNITQPVGGWMLARVFGPASQIEGTLNATGSFILLNQNGVFIAPGAQVSVGGMFAASTLGLSNSNFLNGLYLFQDSGTNGVIRNAGTINAGVEGVYLFAPNVENAATGIITSANGHVSLGAGTTAFLSNRPDGRGFLSQVTAPAGEALNLGQLIADGGQVTMAGRVVNQGNLVQANSVVQRNGRIELVASEQVTMRAGSRTVSAGGPAGSHGGTVIAMAATRDASSARTGGTVLVESGATIDVTPGAGGTAGEVWLGGLNGSAITQNGVIQGTTYRLIPDRFDLTDAELFSLAPGAARGEINVLAMDDLTVSTSLPLDALGLQFGQSATFHLNAGRNLKFDRGSFGSLSSRWNILGRAGQDLTVNVAEVSTGGGAGLHLHAGRDLALFDAGSEFARVHTALTGGNISLSAARDVVVSSPFERFSNGISVPGIHVGLPGDLTIRAGQDVRGHVTARNPRGPGFTLQGGTADVAAGRDIGTELARVNLVLGGRIDNGDGTFTVPSTSADLKAGRSLYFSLAEDFGLREGGYLTANSRLSLTARTGDILIEQDSPSEPFKSFRKILPAKFSATADEGSIVMVTGTSGLSFWPSPTGTLNLSAKHEIRGAGAIESLSVEASVLIYTGVPGDPAARWVRVNEAVALADPTLRPWLQRYGDLSFRGGSGPDSAPSGFRFDLTGLPPGDIREKPTVPGRANIPAILNLNPGSVENFIGQNVEEFELTAALKNPFTLVTPPAGTISISTLVGDLSRLTLNFISPYLRQTTLSSGRDIKGLLATISAPALPGGEVAARIHAKGSLDLRTDTGIPGEQFPETGILFAGGGTGQIRVNKDILLGGSNGIEHRLVKAISSTRKAGGLLDVGVGGNIELVRIGKVKQPNGAIKDQAFESRIGTYNGARLLIHGADGVRLVDETGSPVSGAVEVRGALIPQSGQTSLLALLNEQGQPVAFEAFKKTVDLDPAALSQSRFTHADVVDGTVELVGKPIYIEETNQLVLVTRQKNPNGKNFLDDTNRAVLVDLNPQRGTNGLPILTDGKPALVDGKLILEIGGQEVTVLSPVGGKVTIGGDLAAEKPDQSEQFGVFTQRGGNLTILATGDVDVKKSRIGTLDTGNILIKTSGGTINAGSGSKDEKTVFLIQQEDGKNLAALVPGSGIFTWERDDPDFSTLPFPKFNTSQMDALFNRITIRNFLGRDASNLVAEFDRLTELRTVEFDRIFEDFINAPFGPGSRPLQLGDATLIAAKDIDVPEGGIRCRRCTLEAGDSLNLLGGLIIGKTTFTASTVTGSLSSLAGAATGSVGGASVSAAGGAGGSSVGGLSGATSTVSATSASTSSTSSTAAKAVEQVQQTTAESTGSPAANGKQVASKDGGNGTKSQMAKSVQVKRGVVIQVDVKPQSGS